MLPIAIVLLLYICLFMAYERVESIDIFKDNARNLRIAAAVVLIGTYLLTTTAQYINASGVGSGSLNSYWGRYFLPTIPLLIIFPLTSKKFQRLKITSSFKSLVLAITLICLVTTTFFIG
jgi:uncharacterized membrane protein